MRRGVGLRMFSREYNAALYPNVSARVDLLRHKVAGRAAGDWFHAHVRRARDYVFSDSLRREFGAPMLLSARLGLQFLLVALLRCRVEAQGDREYTDKRLKRQQEVFIATEAVYLYDDDFNRKVERELFRSWSVLFHSVADWKHDSLLPSLRLSVLFEVYRGEELLTDSAVSELQRIDSYLHSLPWTAIVDNKIEWEGPQYLLPYLPIMLETARFIHPSNTPERRKEVLVTKPPAVREMTETTEASCQAEETQIIEELPRRREGARTKEEARRHTSVTPRCHSRGFPRSVRLSQFPLFPPPHSDIRAFSQQSGDSQSPQQFDSFDISKRFIKPIFRRKFVKLPDKKKFNGTQLPTISQRPLDRLLSIDGYSPDQGQHSRRWLSMRGGPQFLLQTPLPHTSFLLMHRFPKRRLQSHTPREMGERLCVRL